MFTRSAARQGGKSVQASTFHRDHALQEGRSAPGVVITHCMATPWATIRTLVSKKKNRYIKDGFNLDLTFVTDRLIAMGFPSVGTEACYRNPAWQVRTLLSKLASQGYQCKVYNLCAEVSRTYSPALLGLSPTSCERHGSFDHGPCPLALIAPFCRSVEAWLAADAKHLVAVHCKAGKVITLLTTYYHLLTSAHHTNRGAIKFPGVDIRAVPVAHRSS